MRAVRPDLTGGRLRRGAVAAVRALGWVAVVGMVFSHPIQSGGGRSLWPEPGCVDVGPAVVSLLVLDPLRGQGTSRGVLGAGAVLVSDGTAAAEGAVASIVVERGDGSPRRVELFVQLPLTTDGRSATRLEEGLYLLALDEAGLGLGAIAPFVAYHSDTVVTPAAISRARACATAPVADFGEGAG